MGVEAIDLYQIRWPIEVDIEEAWEMMATLRSKEKVRWIGVSYFIIEQIKKCQSISPVSSLQPPYSIISRDYEKEVLPFCKENNNGVVVYSPMGCGILTGAKTRERVANFPFDEHRRNSHHFKEPALAVNLAIAGKLKAIGEMNGF